MKDPRTLKRVRLLWTGQDVEDRLVPIVEPRLRVTSPLGGHVVTFVASGEVDFDGGIVFRPAPDGQLPH